MLRKAHSNCDLKERQMAKQKTLKIVGMHCAGCAGSVEKALKGLPGVSAVTVNLAAGQAVVEYEPEKTGEKEMTKAVRLAGFNVG